LKTRDDFKVDGVSKLWSD